MDDFLLTRLHYQQVSPGCSYLHQEEVFLIKLATTGNLMKNAVTFFITASSMQPSTNSKSTSINEEVYLNEMDKRLFVWCIGMHLNSTVRPVLVVLTSVHLSWFAEETQSFWDKSGGNFTFRIDTLPDKFHLQQISCHQFKHLSTV